jgi:hypothetical protein
MASSPAWFLPILRECWSSDTSGQFLPDNPARGQCNVTALVVRDLCGGEILKTETEGGWHFYNRVAAERYDLTASQFEAPVAYADIASDQAEALAGTTAERYAALKARVEDHRMGRRGADQGPDAMRPAVEGGRS